MATLDDFKRLQAEQTGEQIAFVSVVISERDENASELNAVTVQLDTANNTISQKNALITALEKRIAELTGTPNPNPDPGPGPNPTPSAYLFYDPARFMNLPTNGPAWGRLAARARGEWALPDLGNNNAQGDSDVIAGALYAARMNDSAMRDRVIKHLKAAINYGERSSSNPRGLSRTLELGRGLAGYVTAANIIQFAEPDFVNWVYAMLWYEFGEGDRWGSFSTIVETDNSFNSNWATQCRRSVIFACIYLTQVGTPAQKTKAAAQLALSVLAHKRDIGERGDYSALPPLTSSPSGWYGDSNPIVGINPPGTTQVIMGERRFIGGGRGADWLRAKIPSGYPGAGSEDRKATVWPPQPVTYHWEGLTPQVITAHTLDKMGLVPFSAGQNAIRRAFDALYGTGENAKNNPRFVNPAGGDDKTAVWVLKYHDPSAPFQALPDDSPDKAGFGWNDWYLGGVA